MTNMVITQKSNNMHQTQQIAFMVYPVYLMLTFCLDGTVLWVDVKSPVSKYPQAKYFTTY